MATPQMVHHMIAAKRRQEVLEDEGIFNHAAAAEMFGHVSSSDEDHTVTMAA